MIIASLKQLEGNRKNYMQQKRRELRKKEVETQKESNNEFKLPHSIEYKLLPKKVIVENNEFRIIYFLNHKLHHNQIM